MRSQVASAQPTDTFVESTFRRLKELGVSEEQLDAARRGDFGDFSGVDWNTPETEKWFALNDLFAALDLPRLEQDGLQLDPDSVEGHIFEQYPARHYLTELSQIYPKLLKRLAKLDPLQFSDPQLGEASRCYIYGFWRATVVLSATALDSNLLRRVDRDVFEKRKQWSSKKGKYFPLLVEQAVADNLLGQPAIAGQKTVYTEFANFVFTKRNAVVHKGLDTDRATAYDVLNKARGVIEYLEDHSN